MTHALKLQALSAEAIISPAQLQAMTFLRNDCETHLIPEYAKAKKIRKKKYSCVPCARMLEKSQDKFFARYRSVGEELTLQVRLEIRSVMLQPALKAAAEHELGCTFTLLADFPQAYEPGKQGPGGVIEMTKPGEPIDDSCATALLFYQWRCPETYHPPRPEAEAAELLWEVIQHEAPNALRWLTTLAPSEHRIPPGMRDEVHPLLGTPAWQRLLAERGNIRASLTALNTLEVRG